jgi:putative spermidine/putrescine transport system ATP-binding protein
VTSEAGRGGAASKPITIRRLTKHYGKFTALDHIDLEIKSGEFITLLGPSGSGKTTLLMMLGGFVQPDAGSIRFGDQEVVLLPPHKRGIGMVFQNYALFPHMNVAANLAYPLKLRGCRRDEIADRVAKALELVELGGYGERGVHQLSGGQKQRVALARAIIFEPRILLMDEPLSALDKNLREKMQLEIRRLHDRLGLTSVYVTHDQREALTMSDRIAVLNRGRLVQLDQPRDLYEQPTSRFIADFIGETHCVPVEVREGKAPLFGKTLQLDRPLRSTAPAQSLALRPEKLHLLEGDVPPQLNVIEGKLRQHVFQGDSIVSYVTLADGREIAVRRSQGFGERTPEPGDKVRIGIAPRDTIIVPDDEPAAPT